VFKTHISNRISRGFYRAGSLVSVGGGQQSGGWDGTGLTTGPASAPVEKVHGGGGRMLVSNNGFGT
jgi:hypothetical protein